MAGFANYFYKISPFWLQNIGVSLYGYAWHKRRFGGIFSDQLIEFKGRDFYTQKEWENYQNLALRKLLLHAYDNVPYYREVFGNVIKTRDELASFTINHLALLPILEKQDLMINGDNKLISLICDNSLEFFQSSGSTGTPTKIGFSKKMHQTWSAAFEARIRNWAGLTRLDSRGMIGGRRVVPEGIANPPFHRYNFKEKQAYFSAYHISKDNAKYYLDAIKRNNLHYMTGYAMSNFILARFIEEAGLSAPSLKAVITSSEKLTKEMRDTFSRVYNCKTYDSYSGVEACGLISECEFGSLHISPDVGIMEIIKSDGSIAGPGEIGEVISTGLLNYDQPLIRYRIGDSVRLSENQQCSCGREMPIVSEILGRTEDIVIGADGREMVRFHGIFVEIKGLIEGQIIQHDYDFIEVKIISRSDFDKDQEGLMKQRLVSQLGDIKVKFSYVNKIDLGPNGKFKAVISLVNRNK